jgi:hypothetical protein
MSALPWIAAALLAAGVLVLAAAFPATQVRARLRPLMAGVLLIALMLAYPLLAAAVVTTGLLTRRQEARQGRLEALRRHPSSRCPGLSVDGEPLDEDELGEADEFAALAYLFLYVDIPEPEPGRRTP